MKKVFEKDIKYIFDMCKIYSVIFGYELKYYRNKHNFCWTLLKRGKRHKSFAWLDDVYKYFQKVIDITNFRRSL